MNFSKLVLLILAFKHFSLIMKSRSLKSRRFEIDELTFKVGSNTCNMVIRSNISTNVSNNLVNAAKFKCKKFRPNKPRTAIKKFYSQCATTTGKINKNALMLFMFSHYNYYSCIAVAKKFIT